MIVSRRMLLILVGDSLRDVKDAARGARLSDRNEVALSCEAAAARLEHLGSMLGELPEQIVLGGDNGDDHARPGLG